MREISVKAENLTVRIADKSLLTALSFSLPTGESCIITGVSGSGKTTLGMVLSGQIAATEGSLRVEPENATRLFVGQQHDFRYLSSGRTYFSQRYDNNYGNTSPTVAQILAEEKGATKEALEEIIALLDIATIQKSRLIELSNGEGKRVQLAVALLKNPNLIVFDSPFIGLDTKSRSILKDIINKLIEKRITVFILTTKKEIPEKVKYFLELKNGSIKYFGRVNYTNEPKVIIKEDSLINTSMLQNIAPEKNNDFTIAASFKNTSVWFGEKRVLQGINWTIKKGEKWALLGANGAGKSTLLSLITGDNPQVYKNEVYLFDRKRGSGESIWEIKKKIGYVSPELHLYFKRNQSFTEELVESSSTYTSPIDTLHFTSVAETVASGFYDQIGGSQKVSSYEQLQVENWMKLLNIFDLRKKPLYTLSLGEQRIVLLARALVKNPPMLILDEPTQGLDFRQIERFKALINMIAANFNKTILYVSHYEEELPTCINKRFVLEKGEVVQSDPS